jgi:predicted phosphodiesterase
MRYLILSDLHANIEAFEAVIEAVIDEKIDKYVVCGDIVDYGPNPNELIERLMKLPGLLR